MFNYAVNEFREGLLFGGRMVKKAENDSMKEKATSIFMHLLESAIVGTIVAVLISWAAVQRQEVILSQTAASNKDQDSRIRSVELLITQQGQQILNVQTKQADIAAQLTEVVRRLEDMNKWQGERLRDLERRR